MNSRLNSVGLTVPLQPSQTNPRRELEGRARVHRWVVLGKHGDTEVAAFSTVLVGGLPLSDFSLPGSELDQDQIATEVRDAGYRIVKGKGYTSFGVATAIVRICEVILRNERAVLPVSTLLTGEYGIADICLSLPCILGAGGVERTLSPTLTHSETTALVASAEALQRALASMDLAS